MTEADLTEKLLALYHKEVERLSAELENAIIEKQKLRDSLQRTLDTLNTMNTLNKELETRAAEQKKLLATIDELTAKIEARTVIVNPSPAPAPIPMTPPEYPTYPGYPWRPEPYCYVTTPQATTSKNTVSVH